MSLLPVAFETSGGPITLAPELLRVEPLRGVVRLAMMQDDSLQSLVLRAHQAVQVFDVVLPPIVADLRPDEVTVEVDFANAGGNVVMDVRLQQAPLALGPGRLDQDSLEAWQAALPAAAVAGGSYHFTGAATAALVQPTTGRLRVLLHVSQKRFAALGQDADRSNRWRLNRLRLTVVGSVPKTDQTRRF